jgi:hypothetical protein
MKLLTNLLVAFAATGVIGSAQAQTDLGTLAPTGTQQTDFLPSGTTFADLFKFTMDATNNIFTGSVVPFSPTGVDATQAHVTGLQFQLFDNTGNLLFTGVNAQGSLTPGDFSLKVSGTADGPVGGGFQLAVAAHNPEPAEWMLMLCGLVVAGFIARRKIGLMAA